MSKKIYVNGRFLTQKLTGVNRFAYEHCLEMLNQGVAFAVIVPKNASLIVVNPFEIIRFGRSGGHLWEQFILPWFFLFKSHFILLNFSGAGPLLIREKITTIHDMSFHRSPEWFSKSYVLYYKFITPLMIKTSRLVLTVSEFSKAEITAIYPVHPSKVLVLYNAVSHYLAPRQSDSSVEKDFSYVLAVSSIDPRKNYINLIRAFKRVAINDLKLVIVGNKSSNFNIEGFDEEIENRIIYKGHVSDSELQQLYQHALVFVYPSLYEGFGLPPLEAMSNGCPVIISDIPVFRELYSSTAFFVNPLNIEDISSAIVEVATNTALREALISKGYLLNKKFTWKASTSKLIKVIADF